MKNCQQTINAFFNAIIDSSVVYSRKVYPLIDTIARRYVNLAPCDTLVAVMKKDFTAAIVSELPVWGQNFNRTSVKVESWIRWKEDASDNKTVATLLGNYYSEFLVERHQQVRAEKNG